MRDLELGTLEHILADEEALQPRPGFSTRVLMAVREEARAKEPIAFPWARFLPGVLLNIALLLGGAVWMAIATNGVPLQPIPTEWLRDPQTQGLLWATVTLVASCALAWGASNWASPRRAGTF